MKLTKQPSKVLKKLPDDLPEKRKAVIRVACSLVGKVNYFWGGKSLELGWDNRWGQLEKVWAAGNSTTGTYCPFGLDCSGFVDWVFYNVTGGEYILGHGGGASSQHSYCEASPKDLYTLWDEACSKNLLIASTSKVVVCYVRDILRRNFIIKYDYLFMLRT